MNKKILSIFVMIMALSLFGVSCSNSGTTGTDGNNGKTTTVTATVDTLKTASEKLGGADDSLVIKNTGSKTISTLSTKIELEVEANSIVITIIDTSLNVAEDGSKADTKTNLDKVLASFKSEMLTQGVNITADTVGEASDDTVVGANDAVTFTLAASKVADTETTKYVLPSQITDLQNVKIKIGIGSDTGTWGA